MNDSLGRWLGGLDLLLAAILLGGIWGVLPTRWWLIDTIGTVLAVAFLVSAAGLLTRQAWGRRVALVVSWAVMVASLLCVTLLVWSAAHLAGLYGPIGQGGAALFGFVTLFIAPYFIAAPASKIVLLSRVNS